MTTLNTTFVFLIDSIGSASPEVAFVDFGKTFVPERVQVNYVFRSIECG
jgi:hypothetical protein